MHNPILEPGPLPAFSEITPDIIETSIGQLIEQNRRRISELTDVKDPDLDSLIKPLSRVNDRLDKAWSPIRHLNSVKTNDALREAYNNCLPLLSEYATELGQNEDLYAAYQAISVSPEFATFSAAQQKAITDALLHFRLGG